MNDNKDEVREPEKTSEPKKSHRLDIIALILCLAAAIGIWLYVVSTNQTITEKTVIVTVNAYEQIKNDTEMSIISGNDQMDYSQIKVELTVTGTQSALDKYKDGDYIVKLDTTDVTNAGKYSFSFTYELPGTDVTFKSMSPSYISTPVLIDKLLERKVPLVADYREGGVSDGKLGGLTPNDISTVTISGPQSIIETVEKAKIFVNLAGYERSTDIKSNTFELYDEDGTRISNDNLYITVTPSEVEVHVRIDYENRNVPLTVKYETPADSDTYKYTVTILTDGMPDAQIALTGDSASFPASLSFDIGHLFMHGLSGISGSATATVTVGSIVAVEGVIPEGLTVNTELTKVITVQVTKTPIESETTTATDDTTVRSEADTTETPEVTVASNEKDTPSD